MMVPRAWRVDLALALRWRFAANMLLLACGRFWVVIDILYSIHWAGCMATGT